MIATWALLAVGLCAPGAALPQEGSVDAPAVEAAEPDGAAEAEAAAQAPVDGEPAADDAEAAEGAVDAEADDSAAADTDSGPSAPDEPKKASFLDRAKAWCVSLWEAGVNIWTRGGWAMIALAVISYFIFFVGFGVWSRLRKIGLGSVPEVTWRRWIHEPSDREGQVGRMFDRVDEVLSDERASVRDGFDEIRTSKMGPFERDLKLMNIAVGAAPLVGLLGTVTGMLATFNALGAGSGGDKTMDSIAEGISEALYTTETGLVVALPGLFFHYFLSRRFDRFTAFLAKAEAVWSKDRLEQRIARREKDQRDMVRALVVMEVKKRVMARFNTTRAGA